MAWGWDTQLVEVMGRHWFIGEVVRAGLEAAEPIRDKGIDHLVSPPDYSWTLPASSRLTVPGHQRVPGLHSRRVYPDPTGPTLAPPAPPQHRVRAAAI